MISTFNLVDMFFIDIFFISKVISVNNNILNNILQSTLHSNKEKPNAYYR